MTSRLLAATALPLALIAASAGAQTLASDTPATFAGVTTGFDYDQRHVDIAMRDGVKLHAVILVPKGARDAPMLLERTPYNAERGQSHEASSHGRMLVSPAMADYVDGGYILVSEDVRGKYGSKGIYVNERPLIGPQNPTRVDHATDAWDTIEWLVHHVPEANGRVGMVGTSYDGMMVAMALTHPHPALKAAVPMNPVINTWMGDDDFHGGASRIIGYDYYYQQDAEHGSAGDLWRDGYDDYDTFLHAGSASDFVKSRGLGQLGFVRKLHDHPAYDAFWQAQALETILPRLAPTVPTIWVAGQWDQEDMYGAVAAYEALAKVDPSHTQHLVLGPWKHGGWAGDGSSLGPVRFDADTALWFRRTVMRPFLDGLLRTGGSPVPVPPVLAFRTGPNDWHAMPGWPAAGAGQRLYLRAAGGLSFAPPASDGPGGSGADVDGADSYVSDPAKPIPYRMRPIRPTYASGSAWGQWLVDDQRPFSDRTDVLTYETPPLTAPVSMAGAPVANLVASTTGTDGDFVVKLIDVYPDDYAPDARMGGYQLGIAMDIFRGRYREGNEVARPIRAGAALSYRFALPSADHVFLPGHRIMVQVQSSWFPLYDRNPQTFVPNIFDAQPGDYRKATVSVFHSPGQASYIELPAPPPASATSLPVAP
ncbi:CocE/NonD family hydrolase [Sphingomonas bacterium]|uniref:CocE/NonD family hydrolase n=1 Tax=Sphingomonas bacterium TaxID=1895847 RepID=UPI0015754E2F|nr:CocE/NonD family hydrolase [Sphingomonas bacterium]